jgi:hypothetical protein
VLGFIITTLVIILVVAGILTFAFMQYRRVLREAKNYERGLKMVPLYIHIPPVSDDMVTNGRDERDLTEEVLSQAQVMYNIIASTATKGFKSRIYGQRHVSFEVVAHEGLVHYYVVVPVVMIDVITQAVAAAYPSARLEEVSERNIFNKARCCPCDAERTISCQQRRRHRYSDLDSSGLYRLEQELSHSCREH